MSRIQQDLKPPTRLRNKPNPFPVTRIVGATYYLQVKKKRIAGHQKLEINFFSSVSAHALFVRATYLVCHRLISSWKTDLNISLAALELLSGLARVNIREAG